MAMFHTERAPQTGRLAQAHTALGAFSRPTGREAIVLSNGNALLTYCKLLEY